MKSLEGASLGRIRDSKGHLSGKVNIGGNLDSPDINGNLEFFQTSILISKLNSVFKVDNGQILAIDNKGLKFNNFTIKDADDNRFTINGNALTKNYFNYIFDLRLKANDFQALNSSRADNQGYFGKIIFDTDMKVSGGSRKSPSDRWHFKNKGRYRFYDRIAPKRTRTDCKRRSRDICR